MPDIAAARPVAGQPIETAWGQQVHDAIESLTVQSGVTVTSTGAGTTELLAEISFSPAFAAPPALVASASDYGGTEANVCTIVPTPTEYQAQIKVKQTTGGIFGGAVAVHWVAVGRAV